MKQEQLNNPAVLALYRELADAIGWPSNDPRLEYIADRVVALNELAERSAHNYVEEMSDELAALLDSAFVDSLPAARRLMKLIEQREATAGWRSDRER